MHNYPDSMKKLTIVPTCCLCLLVLVTSLAVAACDTPFQNNPHGAVYVNQLTPLAQAPRVQPGKLPVKSHLSPYGLGASIPALVAQYGEPSVYSSPPLYAFQDGSVAWPKGSLIIVTIKENRAVEFSYDPGTDHPMTYQEAQDFAVKLLPDDAQGPKTIQQEDDQNGKCLVKIYHSTLLASIFPSDDFISASGKDTNLGSVTVNFFPDEVTNSGDPSGNGQYTQTGFNGSNTVQSTAQVNSVLINLGDRPSC